jgi:hypothetical protein
LPFTDVASANTLPSASSSQSDNLIMHRKIIDWC